MEQVEGFLRTLETVLKRLRSLTAMAV
jgi:hypothetical protein